MKRLLAIVLNYESFQLSMKCVDAIREAQDIVIVIVDNDSNNQSFEELSEKYENIENIYVVKNQKNTGYAAGNNFGVKVGMKRFPECEYLAIINPDIIVEEKVLQNLVQILEENHNISVIAPTVIENGKITEDSFGWKNWQKREVIKSASYLFGRSVKKIHVGDVIEFGIYKVKYTDCVKGCFFVARAKDFINVGMLDEHTFLYGEEDILGYKISATGKRTACVLNQYCYHEHVRQATDVSMKRKKQHLERTYQSRYYYLKTYLKANLLERACYQLLAFLHVQLEYPFASKIRHKWRKND